MMSTANVNTGREPSTPWLLRIDLCGIRGWIDSRRWFWQMAALVRLRTASLSLETGPRCPLAPVSLDPRQQARTR